ncbi:hypothetical protein EOE18_10680 [Novosphingobium umbonatum]|uniref:Bacteriophage abortive infection AbiH n=2 Tax=Novosphingobium TaxID=165696 RepID=A0A437N3X8_9SPHN|nr:MULTISPECIES: bacteriophage abortive infection AbiH family protein [Novosphingobium]NBC37242.1 hypothetical protein [Novosphingobium ovatum]RVU04625.1 hypothetical protein EOE18_10680 [Novosphingobium umbonatum]
MTRKLFVIGNGFDLHHGIRSGYSDFGRYVKSADPDVYALIEEYLGIDDDFWKTFEERLASFDSDTVIDNAEQFLVSYGSDDWKDSAHHDFEYEIERVVSGLADGMRGRFAKWIRQLAMPAAGSFTAVRCIDPTAAFLNFNYTPTLQQLYGVPDSNVLHIHGQASDQDAQIVLGHGWDRSAEDRLSNSVDEDTDTRVAGGYRLIDDYFARTFKPTEQIIKRNRSWFDNLVDVSEVFVLGHSLSDVDESYLREVASHVDPAARWTVSYRSSLTHTCERFANFAVPRCTVTFAGLASL